jgi:predicted Zn-dependent protease
MGLNRKEASRLRLGGDSVEGAGRGPRPRAGLARAARIGLALVGALALAGCLSSDHGKPQETSVPLPPPRIATSQPVESPEHKRLIALFGGEYHAPATERYLNEVLARLASASGTPGEAYRVTILNTPAVNAFALPSGNLYVTRGLLALANDGSEIAAVMAHEIAHVMARHASQRAELEKRSEVISKAASVIQNREKGEEVQANARLTIASFSRQQEFEADQMGVKVIARAGYDPYGASRFLASLGQSTALRAALLGQSSASERLDMMATHPSTPERVAQTLAAARQISAPGIGDTARDTYLGAIAGITYGDDPSEGFTRGRRFVHPKLGFAFVAPDGFTLENTARAVLGTASGGVEALRLDNVRIPATTTLEDYLASGWIDGLQQGSIEPLTVNGLPAATATARGGEWTFRVAVIRLGTDLYRLIFATRTLTPERDQRFHESIESFRRIPSSEAASIRPLHLEIVNSSSEKVDALAGRMAVPERPLETFLILNGLDHGGPLKPNEKYKLVVE